MYLIYHLQHRNLVSLVQNNKVAAEVRDYLSDTIEKDFELLEKQHKNKLRRRADDKEAQEVLKEVRKELYNPLVEMGGKGFVDRGLGFIMK